MRLAPRLPDGRRCSWQVDLRLIILAFVVLFGFFALVYNGRSTVHPSAGSAAERLQPVTNPPASGVVRRTGYVPIYSSLYFGRDVKNDMIEDVMLARSAKAGISFTSIGRVITNEPQ